MGASATQARHGWLELLTVLAVLLGMIGGFSAIGPSPAWADADCAGADTHPSFDFERLVLELEEIGGSNTLTVDTADDNVTCGGGNSLAVFYNGVQVEVVDNVADAPNFHLSCSVDYDGRTVDIGGTQYTIVDYQLASRHINSGTYKQNCEAFPDPVPDISLVKTAVVGAGSDLVAGDPNPFLEFSPIDDEGPKTALYSYTITNTGEEPLVNLALVDDRIAAGDLDLSDCPEVLAVDASCTATGSEDFVLADAEDTITNVGTVNANGEQTGDPVSDTDPATIDLLVSFDPAISLVKTAVVGAGSDLVAGDPNPFLEFSPIDDEGPKTALYEYEITNIGNEALVDLALVDDRIAAGDLDLSDCPDVLAVDASCTATGFEVFGIADAADTITNLGTVTADGQESGDEVSDTDPATIDLLLSFDPAISLVKTAVVGAGSDLVGGEGDPFLVFSPIDDEGPKTALYEYEITNIGNEALVNLALVDDRIAAGDLDLSDCPDVLAVGASCTATGFEVFGIADAADTITNLGTVTADGEESGDEVSDTDPATIDLLLAFDPAISLVKDPVVGVGSDLVGGEGDPFLVFTPDDDEGPKTALYRYTITNVGDEALGNIALVDDRIAAGDLDLSNCPEVLAVGASCTATGVEAFTIADAPASITNTGTVTADGQESGDEVSDTDPATIDLVVSVPPPPDPEAPAIDLVKTAVVGDGATDGDLVTDPETGLPTLSFSSGSPGDQTAVYEYTITNTGPVTLFNVTLSDDRLGTILDEGQGVTLAPGESTTERASETFSIEDASGGIDNIITNTAVTTGVDGEGTEVSDDDDAVIQLTAQQSSILIDLEKIAVVGAGDVADVDGAPTLTWQEAELDANQAKTIRYRFTITNIGPSTLHDIELTDAMLSDAPLIPATDGLTLEPGESKVLEVDHIVTPEDVFPDDPEVVGGQIEGDLLNTATVRGSNATRDAFDEDSDDAAVLVRAPRAEVLGADVLPAAGFAAGNLVPISLLLLWLGAAAIWLTDRPRPLRY